MIEVLKQMQEALKEYHYYTIDAGLPNQSMLNKGYAAYQAGLKAIAELESQEPVAWQWLGSAHFRKKLPKDADITAWNPLYTAPPQRTWVGLTEQQRKEIERQSVYVDGAIRMTEAKLKEKNT
jgi:hypothetical protein